MQPDIRVIMSKVPKDKDHKDAPVTTFGTTVPGALYSTFGPIPVADVEESNSDSVWAMFEDVPTKAAPLTAVPQTSAEPPSDDDDPEDPFAPTEVAPLRP